MGGGKGRGSGTLQYECKKYIPQQFPLQNNHNVVSHVSKTAFYYIESRDLDHLLKYFKNIFLSSRST